MELIPKYQPCKQVAYSEKEQRAWHEIWIRGNHSDTTEEAQRESLKRNSHLYSRSRDRCLTLHTWPNLQNVRRWQLDPVTHTPVTTYASASRQTPVFCRRTHIKVTEGLWVDIL